MKKRALFQKSLSYNSNNLMSTTRLANDAVMSASMRSPSPPTPLPTVSPLPVNAANNALSALIKYIPTEIVTLYVATLSAAPVLKTIDDTKNYPEVIYWLYIVLTPLLFLLIYISGLRTVGTALPPVLQWPWWKAIASTVAFAVWALAVPGNAYIKPEAGALAGLAALFVSTLLTLLEPIFSPASFASITPRQPDNSAD